MLSIRRFWWAALMVSALAGCSEHIPTPEELPLNEAELAKIKKLPESDVELAIKQKICPVNGEHLGSREAPIKVDVEGKTFFICCGNCNYTMKADPKGVVAKLKP
jgi:YHS domain-containing protein